MLAPEGARLSLLVVLATIPTGVIGVLLEKLIVGPLGSVAAVGVFLLLNSLVLLSSRWIKPLRTVTPEEEETPPRVTSGACLLLWCC